MSPWDNNTDLVAFIRSKEYSRPHYGIRCVLVQRSTIFCQAGAAYINLNLKLYPVLTLIPTFTKGQLTS